MYKKNTDYLLSILRAAYSSGSRDSWSQEALYTLGRLAINPRTNIDLLHPFCVIYRIPEPLELAFGQQDHFQSQLMLGNLKMLRYFLQINCTAVAE